MIKASTGYSAANPQTKYAILGCGLAVLGMVLLFGLFFAMCGGKG
jgi:hypothetical protein